MINTITLNPAIDNILYLDRFTRNQTNRIRETARTMGGKGTHVSMNLALMGSPSRAFGFAFGANGRYIIDLLNDSGVEAHFLHAENGESRMNYMLVERETGDCTLIADRGPQPDAAQTDAFCALLTRTIKPHDFLALSGDTSNFPDPYIYNRLLDLLADRPLKVFLDASGEALKMCVQKAPFLVKPNREELSEMLGRPLSTERDLVHALAQLDGLGIEVIALSMGGEGSLVKAGDSLYRVAPPVVAVFNTVGCGDCFVAGLLHGYEQGLPIEETLRTATAAAAAAAESPLSVGFDPIRAAALAESVDIQKM